MSSVSAPESPSSPIRRWLEGAPVAVLSTYAIVVAFATYFGMYAFRKPWAAMDYDGLAFATLFGKELSLKAAFIISQILGYALSKWLGVKFVTELEAKHRARALVFLILWAEAALVLFALVPDKGKVLAMFANGLPLGAVWGLVFGYLEGRRTSEILGAGLSASYIVASGAVKWIGSSVGEQLDAAGISTFWMPAATGAIFLPVFLGTVWLLKQMPPPTADDIAARSVREPMNKEQRRGFLRAFWPGLLALTVLYFFLTAYRDYRDNFAKELWAQLGNNDSSILATAEVPIAFGVMLALALLYLVKNNRLGLLAAHAMMFVGVALIGVATFLFDTSVIGGTTWMITVGLGLYLAYVPYGCVLFDRMIAAIGVVATAVFMIYVTDAAGYAGVIIVVLYKNFGPPIDHLQFFRNFSYFTSVLCAACFAISALYFWRRSHPDRVQP